MSQHAFQFLYSSLTPKPEPLPPNAKIVKFENEPVDLAEVMNHVAASSEWQPDANCIAIARKINTEDTVYDMPILLDAMEEAGYPVVEDLLEWRKTVKCNCKNYEHCNFCGGTGMKPADFGAILAVLGVPYSWRENLKAPDAYQMGRSIIHEPMPVIRPEK